MKKLKFTQAFTLIELVTVLAIIMIIGGLVISAGTMARKKAMEAKVKSMIAALEVAITMYHADTGQYPPHADEANMPAAGYDSDEYSSAVLYDYLTNLLHEPGAGREVAGWDGPYMEFKVGDVISYVIIDPWGSPYTYTYPSTTDSAVFMIHSWGPLKFNDDGWGDDIRSWLY